MLTFLFLNGSCREVFIYNTLYKVLSKYKENQELLKKKYGRKYKKYQVRTISYVEKEYLKTLKQISKEIKKEDKK